MNNSNCLTDNQGNPLPQVGGSCDLASMHLDASVLDNPEPSDLYGNGMVNNGMLDWEFYNIDPRASAGAAPASQNDFYGNLYSLSTFYGANETMNYDPTHQPTVVKQVSVEERCSCGSESNSKGLTDKQIMFLIALVAFMYFAGKS
jgi:hypothetical protein